MELTYLYHSGFALAGEGFTVVFDYFEDTVSGTEGAVHESLLKRPGRFYVLSSHSHSDHLNPQVLEWKKVRPDLVFVFSKDILGHCSVPEGDAVWMEEGDVYADGLIEVRAFGSTDIGVSFLLEAEGKTIFHAGDLNNWHWMDECEESEWRGYENDFLRELETLAEYAGRVDLAMFPVDPRLGKEYMRGPRQFVERIKTAIFVPMHFDEAYAKAAAFAPFARANGARFVELARRGQSEVFWQQECETKIK